jgi:hypothetical protein
MADPIWLLYPPPSTLGGPAMATAGALAMAANNEIAASTNSAASQADASASPSSPDPNCKDEECESHKNSRTNQTPNHVYIIRNPDGTIYKYGISGRPLNQNGTSPRANQQINKLNEGIPESAPRHTAEIYRSNIRGRSAALELEKQLVANYKFEYGQLPPGNIRPNPTPQGNPNLPY